MGLNILQLSDIHICGNNTPTAEKLLLGNEFPEGAPDVILVTGDLFDCNAFKDKTSAEIRDNIKLGVSFCRELIYWINECYNSEIDERSMLFVPGNHEVNRAATDEEGFLSIYKEFLLEFYNNKIPEWYLEDLSYIRVFEDRRVILLGFVSPCFDSRNVTQKTYDDYGLIEDKQLLRIKTQLKKVKDKEGYSIIVSLHHQFILMEERDKSYVDMSYLRNSEQFIGFLANENVCAVLHGHKHKDSNRRINVELDITKPERMITVLGCGSIAETDAENYYNYLTVYPAGHKYEIEFTSYKRTNAGYELDGNSVRLPLDLNRKGVIQLRNAIRENPDLEDAYSVLISYDTITQNEDIFHVLDSTVFSLVGIAEQIELNPDLLYFILAAAHYRYLINFNAPKTIIDKVDKFISPKIEEYELENVLDAQFKAVGFNYSVELTQTAGMRNDKKRIIVITTLVALIIDFYIVIKFKSEEFFNAVISRKIDFSYSGDKLPSELRGNMIDFLVDYDRRSLEISVTCDTAEAVKISSLIIKEFEMILRNYERYFSEYGFKVYYVLPKIKHNGRNTNEIESRQFTAYIPHLLPLLAGKNIYSKPEAFAREVVQNSVDAINVRKQQDPDFITEGEIRIVVRTDYKKLLNYFEILDNGSGMTKYILERYLTTLGLSYYTSVDYKAMNIQYNPISQFGIGFLSCFMLGKHIEIHTKSFTDETAYYMDIPNYDGCFFIEEDKSTSNVGTIIKIWENPEQRGTNYAFDINRIKDYMQMFFKNVGVNIYVNDRLLFPKYLLRKEIEEKTKKYRINHFIPIEKDITTGIWKPTKNYDKTSRYGVYIFKPDNEIYTGTNPLEKFTLLNNGILIPHIGGANEHVIEFDTFIHSRGGLSDVQEINENYYHIVADFPSETMNLEVSRDVIKHLTDRIDLSTIEECFADLKRKTNTVNAPYYIMQKQYNTCYYSDQNLTFDFEASNETFTIRTNRKNEGNDFNNYIAFLNFLSSGLFHKTPKTIPVSMSELSDEIDPFTYYTVSILYSIIDSISVDNDNLENFINVNAQKRICSSSVLDILFNEARLSKAATPFNMRCRKVANSIRSIKLQNADNTPEQIKKLVSLIKKENKYFEIIRQDLKGAMTSYLFSNKREARGNATAVLEEKTRSESSITEYLSNLFSGYLMRAYASVRSKDRIKLVDIAGITFASVVMLMDLTSILIPVDELEKGTEIRINRNNIVPSLKWFEETTEKLNN